MKKIYGIIILAISLFLPVVVNAASGENFIASDYEMTTTSLGGATQTLNKDTNGNAIAYLGVSVNSGTVYEFNVTLYLNNLTYLNVIEESGWVGTIVNNGDGTLTARYTNATGVTAGKHRIAALTLKAVNTAEVCSMNLQNLTSAPKCEIVNNVYYNKSGAVVTETEYYKDCHPCEIVDGKYRGPNGEELTKEQFEVACPINNPQTGNFLPYFVIIAGIALAAGVYTITRRNSKIYNV